jgi:hypothetical protein
VTVDHWVTLQEGEWLQGALVRYGADMAVYLVVVKPPSHLTIATPWSRSVKGNSRSRAAV